MNGNGKSTKDLIKILAILAMAVFILVKDVAAPLITGRSSALSNIENTVNVNSQRISRLEALMQSLATVPQQVAALSEAVGTLKTTADKIEKKIDKHMEIP